MTKKTNTPTPWWISGKGVIRSGVNGDWVANCYWKNKEGNAKLIVRAVNSHDDLVAALRPFKAFLDKGLEGQTDGFCERVGDDHVVVGWNNAKLTLGDLRRAAEALAATLDP